MSKRAAQGAASSSSRAQRPRYLPPNQPDLAEILGVPSDLTPLLVESLRSATKFFSNADTPQNPFSEDKDPINTPSEQSSSVVDSILNRMASSEEEKKQQKRQERMEEDRQSWLSAVKRKAKECHKGSSTVPLSCFRYLWDLSQEHSRVAVRRASLNLFGCLLSKSSECRMHVSSEDILLKYVTCVVEAKNVKASSEKQVSCWQEEALDWFTYLSESYGDFYPKFRVARQFLQQRCSSSMETQGNLGINMPDLRRIRDIAMQYGDREIVKVDKLIRRAHQCLDVLVPRMGVVVEREAAAAVPKGAGDAADNDSDDDDIDWEDGDEEFDEGNTEEHADAVERTLAAMASSGGLQGGHIEIHLESKEEDQEDSPDAMDENTHKLLQKTVQSIESRHMKRLSSWVNALIKADGLVLNEGKSLVVMPADVARSRGYLLQKLLDRKQTLASILASAAKLGIAVDSGAAVAPSDDTLQPAAVATNIPPPRQTAVLATAARRRYDNKVSRRRSNKLQIKYRTS